MCAHTYTCMILKKHVRLVGIMKKCLVCQKEFPDDMAFCTSCGRPLVQEPGKNPDQEQAREVLQQMQQGVPIQKQEKHKLKMPTVIGIYVFALIIVIAAVVGVFWPGRSNTSPDTDTVVKEAGTDTKVSLPKQSEEPVPEVTAEPTPEVTAEPVDQYQEYYDGLDQKFRNYIMTSLATTKIDTYSSMLKDAITQKDASMCRTVQAHLEKLEEQLKTHSRQKINALKKQVVSWERKSSSKKTVKTAAYQKVKEKAEQFFKAGYYSDAKIQYSDCINRLKAAKEKASKKKISESTSFYKPVYTDNNTYYRLSNYYLSKSDVANMSSEEIRYGINTIFAYVGYRFSKSYIQSFFNYQSWYGGGWTGSQQDIINELKASGAYADTPLSYNYELLKNAR